LVGTLNASAEATGRLVYASRLPESQFLGAIADLTGSPDQVSRLSEAVADPRLDPMIWRVTLHRDLLALYNWAVRRIADSSSGTPPASAGWDSVLSLLPRNGHAIHVIRRAIPFAALGIPTRCGVHNDQRERAARVVRILAEVLGLKELLSVEPMASDQAVAAARTGEELIVVTGRSITVRRITSVASCRVIGSTGRCSVALGSDNHQLERLCEALSSNPVPNSCTQLKAAFMAEDLLDSSYVTALGSSGKSYRMHEVLRGLHPSVVLVAGQKLTSHVPVAIAGYRLLNCDAGGIVSTVVGFGADPVHGWPGDYLV
jgi:hypothetical protein